MNIVYDLLLKDIASDPTITTLLEGLRHPFVLLLIGAGISGFLIPFILNRWQKTQKKLELKTNILAKINECISNITTSLELYELEPKPMKMEDLAKAYLEWKRNEMVIRSNLKTYFSETNSILEGWEILARFVTDLYQLSQRGDAQGRKEILQYIREKMPADRITEIDFNIIIERNKNTIEEIQRYEQNWKKLKEQILKKKDDRLVANIFEVEIPL
jgi:hypothetical protein